jgi:hypothetical protein
MPKALHKIEKLHWLSSIDSVSSKPLSMLHPLLGPTINDGVERGTKRIVRIQAWQSEKRMIRYWVISESDLC